MLPPSYHIGARAVTPQDLADPFLDAIHRGSEPLYHRHRQRYFQLIAEGIVGWRSATPSAIQALVRDAQIKAAGPADAD
jgi:hypothetical protein